VNLAVTALAVFFGFGVMSLAGLGRVQVVGATV
jgi:hypothetical protein